MNDRAQIARRAADQLRQLSAADAPVMVGFDGFVDSIIAVVEKRHSDDAFDPVPTIRRFGEKILDAAGRSANYELSVKLRKLGGNGPIMANALASFGLPTTYIGALGEPELDPVFVPFAEVAECISLCNPGFTDALEFDDGKLMLGKYETMHHIHPERLERVVGLERMVDRLAAGRLLAMVNWTMLTGMSDVWRWMADAVLPKVNEKAGDRKLIFVDLADPEKRTDDDLAAALALLGEMQAHAEVVLGLNLKESVRIANLLDIDPTDDPGAMIADLSAAIRESLAIHAVTVHPREAAAAAIRTGDQVDTASVTAPFTRTPKLSTGAGDNYNAGFCLGLIAGLGAAESVAVGNASSGFYVRHARSATLTELAAFLDDLPEPEAEPEAEPEVV